MQMVCAIAGEQVGQLTLEQVASLTSYDFILEALLCAAL